jgi:hypothetical protein
MSQGAVESKGEGGWMWLDGSRSKGQEAPILTGEIMIV